MEDKYYFYFGEDLNLGDAVQEFFKYKEKNPNTKFVFVIKKEDILKYDIFGNFNSVVNDLAIRDYGLKPEDIQINVENPTHKYTPQEWQRIKENAELLKQQGLELGFEDQEKTWTIKEVEIANSKIQSTAEEIKRANLSPSEILLAVYMKVSSKKYTYESEDEHFSQSRSVYGILNSDRIVCAGYAELMQAILDEIGNENIQVYQNVVAVKREDKLEYHQNLIVHIKDDSYGIDGWYYLDPTWDNSEGTLNYFLVPIKDISKIRDTILEAESYARPKQQRKSAKRSSNSKGVVKNTTYMNRDPENYVSFSSERLFFSRQMLEDIIEQNPDFLKEFNQMIIKDKQDEIKQVLEQKQKELKLLLQAKDYIKQTGSVIGIPSIISGLITTEDIEGFKSYCQGTPKFQKEAEDIFYDTIYIMRDALEKNIDLEIETLKYLVNDNESLENPTEEDKEILKIAKEKLKNMQQWDYIIDNTFPEAMLKLKEYAALFNCSCEDFAMSDLLYNIIEEMGNNNPDNITPASWLSKFFKNDIEKQFEPIDKIIDQYIKDEISGIEEQRKKLNNIDVNKFLNTDDIMEIINDEDGLFNLLDSDKKYLLQAFYEYAEQHSKPIPEYKMLFMIANTIKRLHPEFKKEEVISKAQEIMDKTKERSRDSFNKGATNWFMEI